MASLNYSRLCNRIIVLPASVKSTGKQTFGRLNMTRLKASSAASVTKLEDDHHHHHVQSQEIGQSSEEIKSRSTVAHQIIDLTFNNTKECFKSKKSSELMRAMIVLKLCSYPLLVDNHQKLIKIGQKVLGRRLFRSLMKATFYGHFVAGENETEMSPKIKHIREFGVKSILDYSAEDEIQEDTSSQVKKSSDQNGKSLGNTETGALKSFVVESDYSDARKFRATARSYFYLSEAQCEKNMEIFLNCIDSVANITNQTGFAAIKLTALCRPQLLLKLSKAIMETKHFLNLSDSLNKQTNVQEANNSIPNDYSENHRMMLNLLSWNQLISFEDVINYFRQKDALRDKVPFKALFDQEEEEMFCNLIRRIETIAKHAHDTDVRIMIDAEQTYLQPAINRITIEMMKKYNKNKSIVFNTYQCYLKNTFDAMLLDLDLSYTNDFYFGAKLVRGAYMEQERLRAKNLGYEDPINENFEATTAMYHKTLAHLMGEIIKKDSASKRIAIMVASHNEDTVRFAVENMAKLGILPAHKVICFGQLYAMSDHISFSLGQSGYSVYKYIPYGPVDEVLPYLSRRAIENSSVLAKATRERTLIRKEIVRRFISGEWFYKPEAHYNSASTI
ncbi:proline dehydrogenase 1, mitochondrial isoform X2 [Tetranychus urticae]|uniref:proline dehydrogenase 1, mitochondrial isoform X2 n=1 Tax=Tetranychus urticae TaxID=32264 RepID=UPI00077B9CBE|nr:proline dehydrogenase 1, mitochondrial isoform X2 [Tetranychus urticae]